MLTGCTQKKNAQQTGEDGKAYIHSAGKMEVLDMTELWLEDYGILASTDPTDLLNRIDKQHGVHTIEHAAKIGLGNRKYTLVEIDK